MESDECLFIRLSGELEVDTLRVILKRADSLIDRMKKEQKQARVLVDVEQLETVKLESRKYGVNWLRKSHYDRISVYGKNTFMKYFVNMLVSVLDNNMRYFDNKQEAQKWLQKQRA